MDETANNEHRYSLRYDEIVSEHRYSLIPNGRPLDEILLAMLRLTKKDFGTFLYSDLKGNPNRNGFIMVLARCGDGCYGEEILWSLMDHPEYITNKEDLYDKSLRVFSFSVPDKYRDLVEWLDYRLRDELERTEGRRLLNSGLAK